jgi:short-subunit dehydrogenase
MVIKNILITGASNGLGAALAQVYAKAGHNLILVARDVQRLQTIAHHCETTYSIKTWVMPTDLSIPGACEALIESLHQLDISIHVLINNAGFGVWGSFGKTALTQEIAMVNLHIQAVLSLTKLCLPSMLKKDAGQIINIGSILPVPYQAVYAATKSFLLSFSLSLSHELRDTSIIVNCICPGGMPTGFRESIVDKEAKHSSQLTPEAVAGIIYAKANKKRWLIIPGRMNQLFARCLPWLPKRWLLPLVCWLVYVLRPLTIDQ